MNARIIERAIIGAAENWQQLKIEAQQTQKMKPSDVQTTHDLDVYRWQNPLPGGCIDSRYNTLTKIVGKKQADRIMRKLEVASW